MSDNEKSNTLLDGLFGKLLIPIIISAFTTLLMLYTNAKITEKINENQTADLRDLSDRVHVIEADRYTEEDAEKDRVVIIRELDFIRSDLIEIKRKLE